MSNKVRTIFEVEGTLGDVNFYRKDGELMVRRVGRVSAERIRSEKAFQRTRENNAEFAICAEAGKLIRQSLTHVIRLGKDSKVSSRMLRIMFKLRAMDTVSRRGERQVSVGLQTAPGRQLLMGFEFNAKSQMGDLFGPETLPDATTDTLDILQFAPGRNLADMAPDATHIAISFMSGAFDLENKITYSGKVDTVNLAIDAAADDYHLTSELSTYTGNKVYALLIEFFQEINGRQYALYNGQYNMCKILSVMS